CSFPSHSAARLTESAPPLLSGELLRVTRVRPGPGLHVGEDLLDVVPVVVHPLLEEIGHAEPPDLGMLPAALEVGGGEAAHDLHALRAHALELGHELRGGLHVVAAASGHLVLVPTLELGI